MRRKIRVKRHRRKGRIIPAHSRLINTKINRLSKKYGVPPPKVKYIDMDQEFRNYFGFRSGDPTSGFDGNYDYRNKTILLDRRTYEPGTLEHEFKHYLQHLENPKKFEKFDNKIKKVARKSYQRWSKMYDKAPIENEAFRFEKKVTA